MWARSCGESCGRLFPVAKIRAQKAGRCLKRVLAGAVDGLEKFRPCLRLGILAPAGGGAGLACCRWRMLILPASGSNPCRGMRNELPAFLRPCRAGLRDAQRLQNRRQKLAAFPLLPCFFGEPFRDFLRILGPEFGKGISLGSAVIPLAASGGPADTPACEVKLRSASAFPSSTWERGSVAMATASTPFPIMPLFPSLS